MKFWDVERWGITTQLVLIAVIPTFVMAVVTNFYLYQAAKEEVLQDVQSQGQLIASSLAQSAPYALVSGNTQMLERSLARLVTTHPGVQSIAIRGADGHAVLTVGVVVSGAIQANAPVQFESLDAEVFDSSTPHVSMGPQAWVADQPTVIGQVAVTMSPEPILILKRQRLFWATFIILAAALASVTLGLTMALRLRRPLRGFVQALQQIGVGNYEITVNPRLRGELAAIQQVIVSMAQALKIARQALEDKVRQRTQELNQALQRAVEANQEKRRLINRVNELMEDERRRIALEIHDSFNASIVTIRLWTGSLTAQPKVEPEVASLAKKIMSALDDLYRGARRMIKQMHPEILDTVGLRAAIEEMVRNLDEAHPECKFALTVDGDFPTSREPRSITIYRLVQEALSNVVKHSGASFARVVLSADAQGVIRVVINDNGKGFDVGNKAMEGIGLIGMRERVINADGDIQIASDESGTTVRIELPPNV